MSTKQRRRLKEFDGTAPLVEGKWCCFCGSTHAERHHPFGRNGKFLNVYIYICQTLHAWTHDNIEETRAIGLLQPEYFGHLPDPEIPKPWEYPFCERCREICASA